MLPNRTYNELNESCFSQTELSEEAKLRAGLSARKNRRSSLQLTADRKALIAIYKKMQEREEQWGALEALFRDFYIVERVLNDCDERPKRLPVLLHGSAAGRWKRSGKRLFVTQFRPFSREERGFVETAAAQLWGEAVQPVFQDA